MKGLLFRGLVVAALGTAIAVPTASASSRVRVRLSILPLPASRIGPAAKGLQLRRADSGLLVNGGGNEVNKLVAGVGLAVTPNHSFGFFFPAGPVFARAGRVSGYVLDYGLGAGGGSGVTEVRTGVDEYTTRADARKGLALWKQSDREVTRWAGNGLAITKHALQGAPVGRRRFAFLVSYSDSNIAPLFGVDEQFTVGRYEADVTVWAGSATAAEKLEPRLARKLDGRIKRALAGRLKARPVKLPRRQKAGPPPGGPDLSALALQTGDLGQATAFTRTYTVPGGFPDSSAFAVSAYTAMFSPAGQFNTLSQMIQWFATANQAGFEADFASAFFGQAPLDLSGVGDGARGLLANGGSGSSTGNVQLVFSSGRLEENIYFSSDNPIQTSDAQGVAQRVAGYINAAGLGS